MGRRIQLIDTARPLTCIEVVHLVAIAQTVPPATLHGVVYGMPHAPSAFEPSPGLDQIA
ncbi:hypothetical protein DPMN_055858 [Dreissena polymorpha]|uniref:Uncharacterized protein n=1 Tax=Dreissena polymorpha TaxID=45954 RepID=A0A9D4HT32_DREPO|nr:hypothetical protein DPMN_055858 [Dreissena polymorpha]